MTSSANKPDSAPCHNTPTTVVQPHKVALLKRMKRIEGQVRGVAKMIESDRYCVDVLTQISAIKSAINSVGFQILEDHTKGCVKNAVTSSNGDQELTELLDIVRKFTR